MNLKVGDIVIYHNPMYKNHKANGSKYKIVEIVEYDYKNCSSDWSRKYKSTYCVNIEHISGYNVTGQKTTLGQKGFYNKCFKLANSTIIKERLGVK